MWCNSEEATEFLKSNQSKFGASHYDLIELSTNLT